MWVKILNIIRYSSKSARNLIKIFEMLTKISYSVLKRKGGGGGLWYSTPSKVYFFPQYASIISSVFPTFLANNQLWFRSQKVPKVLKTPAPSPPPIFMTFLTENQVWFRSQKVSKCSRPPRPPYSLLPENVFFSQNAPIISSTFPTLYADNQLWFWFQSPPTP